ncbi:thiamine pyrophosphate-binding protein [Umezawaea tangerina]|uniref:Acetolactate synthase-1/2/3 large subunit n=1 Tax=Umezawaea tangerina TaxID=84725 RepID=A0A2T0T9L1_9PSEU|nr:thiamine pyrophosphate-binding protein [Umezawaea tangerina]PRY42328.1 acetolactate synthase-1/2/3 large subunit [Umezawaea tangerina]
MTSGAERLLEVLAAHDVEVVFGLPGVHNLAIWEALRGSGIRMIGVRHEQTAVYAADGYARTTGRLGVAIVTTGPGAANTLGAVGEAWASGSPVLVVATDIPSTLRRPDVHRGVLHETRDQRAMFLPVVKDGWTVGSADELAARAHHAVGTALAAPQGPVYLGVPTDFLTADAADADHRPAEEAEVPDLTGALALIAAAQRPLVWAGGGAQRSGAGGAVGELARRISAPVVTTYAARGLLPLDHPCAVHGPAHVPEVGALWDDADLVIAVGTDFDGMSTQNWAMPAPRKLLCVTVDAADATKNYPADVVLLGDARQVVGELAERVPEREFTNPVGTVNAEVRRTVLAEDPQAAYLLSALEGVSATLVADMCVAGYWVGGFHRVDRPRGLSYPVGWGTLGFGFPAALGAAVAGRTVAVCGDGGFLFACGDLATAAQERLPVTVVVVDDGGYGMLRYDQEVAGHPTTGVDLRTPDFVALATSFGVPAMAVDGFGPVFGARLTEFVAAEGPNVLVVNARLKPPPTTSPRWYRR